jgi:hypothetical protein
MRLIGAQQIGSRIPGAEIIDCCFKAEPGIAFKYVDQVGAVIDFLAFGHLGNNLLGRKVIGAACLECALNTRLGTIDRIWKKID